MSLVTCCLLLYFVSFSKAYTSLNIYKTDYAPYICILGNTPVCGTNGHEYFLLDNACEFNIFNSKQLEKGQMILSKTALNFCYPPATSLTYGPPTYNTYCPQYCNKAFKPICASYRNVQRNFTNECLLKKHICETKENWQIILNDTCVAVSCPLNGQEICASYNGYSQSFPNLLSLYGDIQARGKNWEILNVGPCPCPEDYRPICAQLNCTAKTFTNECFMEREIKNGEHWSLLFFGECPELPTTISPGDDFDGVESGDGPLNIDGAIDNNLNKIYEIEKAKQISANKPVYIVKKNQISPYMPQILYQNKISAEPIDYVSYNMSYQYKDSFEQPPKKVYENMKLPKTYSDSYEQLSKIVYESPSPPNKNYQDFYENRLKKPYENIRKPQHTLYNELLPDIYSKNLINYDVNANPPDYQSFFKPLNAPIAASAFSIVSSIYNNNDYYAPKTVTDTDYQSSYLLPVYSDVANIYYGNENLYDSFYESFT